MANGRRSKTAVDSQEVARLAYELYEQRGRTDGQDLGDWLMAETLVRRRSNNGSQSKRPAQVLA